MQKAANSRSSTPSGRLVRSRPAELALRPRLKRARTVHTQRFLQGRNLLHAVECGCALPDPTCGKSTCSGNSLHSSAVWIPVHLANPMPYCVQQPPNLLSRVPMNLLEVSPKNAVPVRGKVRVNVWNAEPCQSALRKAAGFPRLYIFFA